MDKIQQAKLMKSALIDADHLAECAERLLAALNKVAGAEASIDATYGASDREKNRAQEEFEQAEAEMSEYWRATHSAAYEYRKRAERARAALTPNVELTGAARLYRAASRERSERG